VATWGRHRKPPRPYPQLVRQRLRQNGNLIDLRLAARPRQIHQSVDTRLGVPVTPLENRRPARLHPPRDLGIRHTIGGKQHDPGPRHHSSRSQLTRCSGA